MTVHTKSMWVVRSIISHSTFILEYQQIERSNTGTKHKVIQEQIVSPANAGVVPPIRGNGLVVNMGISTDCYDNDKLYDNRKHMRNRDGRHYRDWKILCTWCSSARVGLWLISIENITRIANSHRKKIARKSTLESTLDCDVHSNTNARTQVRNLSLREIECAS